MSVRFEELDWRPTPMGDLVLRRRFDAVFDKEVHEIKLGDDFLMSSLFTVAEEEVASRSLARLDGDDLDVVVGGLGLGFTALTVLADARVRSLVVVDALAEVIEWHERGLIPAGPSLAADPRCSFAHGDFFAMARTGFGRRVDAIVVDIDHSPRHVLHPSHAAFYTPDGLRALAEGLRPGGVFGLWSNDPPDEEFTADLASAFATVAAEVVAFDNPLQDRQATATLYFATTALSR